MRVLDISVWRPMPHATQLLCDLGAEVLKVEPPGGDPLRQYPEIFAGVARGKRSTVIDLKQTEGRARVLSLAQEADVVCEGFRPGVVNRLGVGYQDVAAVNPTVIYCSISGFGQSGPLRDAPGHDLSYQAFAGAIKDIDDQGSMDASPDVPQLPALPIADLAAGTYAALSICAAWSRRIQTGEGERIDVAMADVVASWVGPVGKIQVEGVDRTDSGSPGYGIFRSADGDLVTLAALSEQHLWDAICDGLDLPDLRAMPFQKRLALGDELNDVIRKALAQMPREEAVARLKDAGAPVMPVLSPEEMVDHPHLRSRGMVIDARPNAMLAFPAILTGHPRRTQAAVPELGKDRGFSSH